MFASKKLISYSLTNQADYKNILEKLLIEISYI
jgi:hypothetical protein